MTPYRMPATSLPPDTGVSADATLPGLRGLDKLADLRPVIVQDSREQTPLVFTRLASVVGTLYSADYSVSGLEHLIGIERKSIDDLSSCCMGANRSRFERELHRLRGYRFARLLVIGSREDIASGRYCSQIAPKAVLATLAAFEVRYDLPIVFADTPEAAAREVERWAWWFSREVVENANDLLRGSR
jgi:ERCC4-type nuclease